MVNFTTGNCRPCIDIECYMYHWLMFVCGGAINNIALVLTPQQFSFWRKKVISFLQ